MKDYSGPPEHHWLPATDMPSSEQSTLAPWIATFVGLDAASASQTLRKRWASVSRPALKLLRDKLASFEVRAVVATYYGGAIYLVRPGADHKLAGNSLFLPGPPERKLLQRRMRMMSPSENVALREFLTYFGGLSEEINSGLFVSALTPYETFPGPYQEGASNGDEWEGSLVVFGSRCGDLVLLHPEDGTVGWYLHEDHSIKVFADDFDEFIRQYAASLDVAWPYDPWGQPTEEVRDVSHKPSLRIFCDEDMPS